MTQLITPEYQAQQQAMHAMKRGYGGVTAASDIVANLVLDTVNEHKPKAVLDYGAGKGHMGELLFINGYRGDYWPYDPAIPYWAKRPEPAPLVLCLDVLEHIEPDLLDNVLDDLRRVTVDLGIFSVCHREARKTLPDGRNAHLIVQPQEWWTQKLAMRWQIDNEIETVGQNDKQRLGTIYAVRRKP